MIARIAPVTAMPRPALAPADSSPDPGSGPFWSAGGEAVAPGPVGGPASSGRPAGSTDGVEDRIFRSSYRYLRRARMAKGGLLTPPQVLISELISNQQGSGDVKSRRKGSDPSKRAG